MRKKYFTSEVKIALTAIVALVLLFLGLNFLKGINLFKTTNSYYVEFPDIMGLTTSSPVYANGYAVGIVRGITYDYEHTGRVIANIELDKEMRVPQGTRAEIESEMLGSVKMNLILAPNPIKHLSPRDTIKGGIHDGALQKVETLLPAMEQILPKIDSILCSLNNILSDPAITATLNNTREITENLKRSTVQLNNLMENDIPRLTNRMDKIGANAEQITENLKQIDVAATMQSVNATINNVNQMTATLNDRISGKDNSLGLLLNDRSVYDNLNATMKSANELLIDLKSHPKRYVHFSVFGKKDKADTQSNNR